MQALLQKRIADLDSHLAEHLFTKPTLEKKLSPLCGFAMARYFINGAVRHFLFASMAALMVVQSPTTV